MVCVCPGDRQSTGYHTAHPHLTELTNYGKISQCDTYLCSVDPLLYFFLLFVMYIVFIESLLLLLTLLA